MNEPEKRRETKLSSGLMATAIVVWPAIVYILFFVNLLRNFFATHGV